MNRYILFILTLLTIGCSHPYPKTVECAYLAKGADSISSQGVCGKLTNEDTLVLDKKHFNNLNFATSNITTIYVPIKEKSPKVFYVSKSGKIVRSFYFDNGADYFEENLSRTIAKGKFGFIDPNLKVIIAPKYDFAYPFKNGKAKVCNGCTQQQEEEHSMMVGGKWGLIDTTGKLIEPLK